MRRDAACAALRVRPGARARARARTGRKRAQRGHLLDRRPAQRAAAGTAEQLRNGQRFLFGGAPFFRLYYGALSHDVWWRHPLTDSGTKCYIYLP